MTKRKRWWWPTSYSPSVAAIDIELLAANGFTGVIIDLDNTLVGYRQLVPGDEDARWILAARDRGLRVVMVTNNATPWAAEVARALDIPCIGNARKPLPVGFRRALRLLALPRRSVVVIGDQLFTDILGAKMFGLAAILVEPLVGRDPLNTRPLRVLERWLLHGLPRN
jgi:HAD superfamily phosphatase (TIGR01668 family)